MPSINLVNRGVVSSAGSAGCTASFDMPQAQIGGPPVSLTLQMNTSGSEQIDFTGFSLQGSPPGLWELESTPPYGPVQPGATVSLTIRYTPPAK
jgi:hypothetical protein